MTNHDRLHDTQPRERSVDQVRLFCRCPALPTGALAIAEPWAVEDDDPVSADQPFGDATRVVVVPGHSVAVEQDDGTPCAPVAVVQPHAVHLDEGARGRVPALCQACDGMVYEGQRGEDDCDGQENG